MVETKVNLDNVLALLNLAENTPETLENEPESSQNTRTRSTAANKLVDGLAAFKRFFESNKDEPESVPRVINCLVKVMSGMFKSISEQGRQIKNILEELKSEKNRREELLVGMESELDMVLRMVYDKTGVWIPYEDVSACHRFGKEESHSYVLKVWNWKKYSAWDKLNQNLFPE